MLILNYLRGQLVESKYCILAIVSFSILISTSSCQLLQIPLRSFCLVVELQDRNTHSLPTTLLFPVRYSVFISQAKI